MLKNCLQGSSIKLPQLCSVEFIKSRDIPDGFAIKQARIVRKASGYFIMLALECDVNVPDVKPWGCPMGIVLGLDKFLATSQSELVERPRFFAQLQRQLKLLQRRLKHKVKGSSNRRKLGKKIARLYQRIAETRKDFHFKLAHQLCDSSGMIFAEDIDERTWAKGILGEQTLDVGFSQFMTILQWVCWKRGVYFTLVDKKYTSQCPECETCTGKKNLSERIQSCQSCGYTTHRDVAAAQVIRNRGISAVGRTVSQIACGGEGTGTANLVTTRRDRKRGAEVRIEPAL